MLSLAYNRTRQSRQAASRLSNKIAQKLRWRASVPTLPRRHSPVRRRLIEINAMPRRVAEFIRMIETGT
jgi:hypothetical protein